MSGAARHLGRLAVLLLVGMLTLAACAPASATAPAQPAGAVPAASGAAPPPPAPLAQADWAAVVAAAKNESVVACACPPRPDFSRILKEGFEAANPGLRLDTTPAPLPEFPVRVSKEQDAGMYLWDIYMFGPGTEVFDIKDQGAFEPFRDFMVGPDVGGEAAWEGGFDRAFLDREGKYIFGYWYNVSGSPSINRDLLPNFQLQSHSDLLDPALKGKLVMVDPRIGGSGQSTGAYVYAKYGRDTLKRLLVDQEMLLTKGNVEVAEQLVRGGRPVAVSAMSYDALIPFVNAGVPLNLERVRSAALEYAIVGGSSPAVFKNPPHPNATKLFVNWLLSKDGQTLLATELKQNSARKDVAVGDPDTAPLPGVDYLHLHKEVNAPLLREASQAAREFVP